MSGTTSKKNLRLIAAVVIILIVIGAGGLAYYYYSSSTSASSMSSTMTSSMIASSTVVSSTMVSSTTTPSPLILYSADAYVIESTTLETAFTSSTGIMMAPPKAGGSLLLAQEIAQGNPVSVFISVSRTAVTPKLLGNTSSGWAISFATDQMALAYTNASLQNSAASTAIAQAALNTTQGWSNLFSIITSGSVKVGISNPNADPAGYRGWIVLEAAGQVYANNPSYFKNRMLSNAGNITGASAADLVGPLETGQIQFLFIYKSSAIAHNLNYLQLPDQINLGNPEYSKFYSKFSYKITSGVQKGGVISLFITVPSDSTDPADSMQFVVFVVKNSPTLLSSFGLIPITPARLYNDTAVPQPLQQLVAQGYLQPSGPL